MGNTEENKFRRKKKLGSYPYLSVVFSITLALIVIGLFGLLLLHTQKLASLIKQNIEVQVYLDKNISENNIARLRNILLNSEYIARTGDEPAIVFISREEAAKQFIDETEENFADFLGDNPLRDVFVIKIAEPYQETESLAGIKTEFEKLQGVFEVTYLESLISSINQNTTKISLVLLGFAILMVAIVVVLINNTIKLALFSQRFLIRSMQLVGAKASFIQWPFLRRSIWHGLFSGALASLLLYALLNYANRKIEGLARLQNELEIMSLFGLIMALGAVIAFITTFRSIKKYLKLSLDELY
ncbi:MAG: ABC transporter permease [Cyclobacteriaceae bacterium]|nr:ABC transporter permease [Cyclobacteriaceae bacterium]